MSKTNFRVEGMEELIRAIRKIGKLSQQCVTPAARKGATIALKTARAKAPWDTGELANGIILKGERTRKKGKKVYQVTLDPAKNDIFVKITKDGKRYYYPASMEYGFITRDGSYVPGYHYLRDALVDNKTAIERTVIEELIKQIDKLK